MYSAVAVLLLAIAGQPKISVRLAAPVDPSAMARIDQIESNLTPSAKMKVHNAARALRASSSITDGTSRMAVVSAFKGQTLSEAAIEYLIAVAAMEARKDAAEQEKLLRDELAKLKQQQDALRLSLQAAGKLPNPAPHRRAAHTTAGLYDPPFHQIPPPLAANADVSAKLKRYDDLDAFGELDLQQIQQLAQQQQESLAVASNMLAKIKDTNAAVIRNLK